MSKRTLNLVIENRVVAVFESEIVLKIYQTSKEEPIIIEQAKTMFEISGAETLVENGFESANRSGCQRYR